MYQLCFLWVKVIFKAYHEEGGREKIKLVKKKINQKTYQVYPILSPGIAFFPKYCYCLNSQFYFLHPSALLPAPHLTDNDIFLANRKKNRNPKYINSVDRKFLTK